LAFEEVKLDMKDMIKRAISTLGYVYKPGVTGPNVFDQKGKPVCYFRQAKFWPEGHVCLWVETSTGIKHLDVDIDLSENEVDLLAGSQCDESELH